MQCDTSLTVSFSFDRWHYLCANSPKSDCYSAYSIEATTLVVDVTQKTLPFFTVFSQTCLFSRLLHSGCFTLGQGAQPPFCSSPMQMQRPAAFISKYGKIPLHGAPSQSTAIRGRSSIIFYVYVRTAITCSWQNTLAPLFEEEHSSQMWKATIAHAAHIGL